MKSPAVQQASEAIILKRMGSFEEVSKAVLFLASEESSYITAQTINVNGGLYLDMDFDKTILFIGGGIETLPGVKIAKSMNLRVGGF